MRSDRGFSLVEVLVALVIVGFALTAISEVFGTGLLGARTTEDAATALSLAEAKIAEAGTVAALRPGGSSGRFGERFDWWLQITPYDDPQQHDATEIDAPHPVLQPYRIAVAVGWRDGARRHRVRLSTIRLGPASP